MRTRIVYCPKTCDVKHCCGTCKHYAGGIEFIPTRICITCNARSEKTIVLPDRGYPTIDGVVEKQCQHWEMWRA